MLKKRIHEIDILRGITFLAVVMQHSLAGFIYEPGLRIYESIPSALLLNIIRFAVPLFVVITGFSLYYSDKGIGYISFIGKRFKQIILPYLLWTAIYDLFIFFINGMKIKSLSEVISEYIKYSLTGTASYHLWYMVLIIQFYFLYPMFKLFINKNRSKINNTIILIVFFILHILLLYWYNNFSADVYKSSEGITKYILAYKDRLFIMWMFYFFLGAYFALYYNEIKLLLYKIRYITGVGFLVSLLFVMKKMTSVATINENSDYIINHFLGSPLNTLMFPLLIFSILFIYPLAEYILNNRVKIGEYLISVGKYSFGAYLIHALVLRYVNAFLRLFFPWFYMNIILSFIITSIISLSIIKFFSNSNNAFLLTLVGIIKKKDNRKT